VTVCRSYWLLISLYIHSFISDLRLVRNNYCYLLYTQRSQPHPRSIEWTSAMSDTNTGKSFFLCRSSFYRYTNRKPVSPPVVVARPPHYAARAVVGLFLSAAGGCHAVIFPVSTHPTMEAPLFSVDLNFSKILGVQSISLMVGWWRWTLGRDEAPSVQAQPSCMVRVSLDTNDSFYSSLEQ